MRQLRFALGALALASLMAGQLMAQVNEGSRPFPNTNGDAKVTMTHTYRASTLIGMPIRNSLNENVGTIDELVIDVPKGEIRYVAMAVGGFLGIGDKLFAVPWQSLTLKHGEKETFFFLDVDKDKLKNAPGFAKDNWPNVADPKFGDDIDRFYSVHRRPSTAAQPAQTTTPRR